MHQLQAQQQALSAQQQTMQYHDATAAAQAQQLSALNAAQAQQGAPWQYPTIAIANWYDCPAPGCASGSPYPKP